MDVTQAPPHVGHRAAVDADHIGNMGRYIYQIRNMLALVLVFWLVSIAAAVGVGIYMGSHSSQATTGQGGVTCQPAGTINPC